LKKSRTDVWGGGLRRRGAGKGIPFEAVKLWGKKKAVGKKKDPLLKGEKGGKKRTQKKKGLRATRSKHLL